MLLLDISNGAKTIVMLVLIIAVFYFFLIRPQRQQAKKEAASGELSPTSAGTPSLKMPAFSVATD